MPRLNLDAIDFSIIPNAESDEFEFKSSATLVNELGKKLSCAASGFSNSGGGVFVAGVDGNGDADGGLPSQIGRQDLRDWVDQIVHQVVPAPNYDIKLLDDPRERGTIKADHCVLLVKFDESYLGPHMAPDNRYYIRAGAHTVAARHFIVDAVWAKRHFAKPRLTHTFRTKTEYSQTVQLGIVGLTSTPAVDVEVYLEPLGELLAGFEKYFPLQIPVIDPQNPFFFDVSTWTMMKERFGEDVELTVNYKDLAGNVYSYKTKLDIVRSFGPMRIGSDLMEKIAKSLESIDKSLKKKQA